MSELVNLSAWQMVSAYLFIAVLLAIVRVKGTNRERDIIIATVRMTIQLVLMGYVLVYVFKNPHPLLTLLIIAVMQVFSIHNIYKRVKIPLSKRFKKAIALAMVGGTLTCLFYFMFVVIRVVPWYDPRYFIPIAGMIVGNSMTGIALGASRLADGMRSKKDMVETALMLGATPRIAAKQVVDQAFDSAILPTINSMLGMGIVFLPGMMTGQILSGVSPLSAIAYQIAIMLGILGSVSLTVTLLVQLGYRTFFNGDSQLVDE